MRYSIVLLLFVALTSCARAQEPTPRIDSARISSILFQVLDTLAARVDSSELVNPYSDYPASLKTRALETPLRSGFTFQPASAYFKGCLDAISDLRQGRMRIMHIGLETIITLADSTSWHVSSVLAWTLLKKYAVVLDQAGDLVDPWIVAYVKGYNQIAEGVITRYFGRDVILEASDSLVSTIATEGGSHSEWRVSR